MSQTQWKAYFSMFVLGQTNPIGNPRPYNNQQGWRWGDHQSDILYDDVMDFKYKTLFFWRNQFSILLTENIKHFPMISTTLKHIFSADEYCRCCGYPSYSYHCDYCEEDRCGSCGEIGCGSYMCHSCRRMDRD